MNINHTRDLVRMGNTFYDRAGGSSQQRKEDLERLSLCTWAFVRAMKRHLSPARDEEDFKNELFEKLPKEATDFISYIESICGVPVKIVSTGPDDLSTIVR